MDINRRMVIDQIEKLISGQIAREDIGWWAYDLLLEQKLNYEPGFERLLEDTIRSLHYFHDNEPMMQQFYPDTSEILYYVACLKGQEFYQRSKVVHWKV